jgi:ABC-type lipoprotein export system ATPase subunit
VILELRDLCKSFELGSETVAAVRDVDLSIDTGEVLVLLGPSGAGKSTLLLLAAGAERPDAGIVRFRGSDLSDLSSREFSDHLRENVGIVYQHPRLLTGHDALSNAAMKLAAGPISLSEARRKALPILAKVGLSARLDHRPGQLSGGEQRRVALARAMVNRPPLLLLDEPTANLDSTTATTVLDLIAQAADGGAAVLLVTHDEAAGRIATRTSELRDGKISGSALARAA